MTILKFPDRIKDMEGTGQHRPNAEDIAWLAGVLDAEGHISFQQSGRKHVAVKTVVFVGNTSLEFVEEAQRIAFAISHRKPRILRHGKKDKHGRNFDYWAFYVHDQKSCRKICRAVLSKLIVKKLQAEILIEFCELRKGKRHKGYNSAYGEEEMVLLRRMQALRRTPTPLWRVSTERDAPAANAG